MGKPTINNVWNTIRDGALGVAALAADGLHLKIGLSSAGTAGQIYSFTDPQDVIDTLGYGPLSEALAFHLKNAGGTVYAYKASGATAATTSAVTKTAAAGGSSTGTIALTGSTPFDSYVAQVKITRSGTLNAGAFQYTLDNQGALIPPGSTPTWSPEIAIPSGGTYTIPNTGITLTFTPGAGPNTFYVGDLHTFTTAAPAMTNTDVSNAFTALLADATDYSIVHLVGEVTATIAANLDTQAAAFENAYRYLRIVCEGRDVDATTDSGAVATWRTNIKTEWAAFVSKRVAVAAGHALLVSGVNGRMIRRSGLWATLARVMSVKVQTHPGQVDLGALRGVVAIVHDEDKNPLLDAAGFTTLRTIQGRKGFYNTNFRMMAGSTSDYFRGQNARVMDKACTVARNALLDYLNKDIPVDPVSGFIVETEAAKIDSYVGGKLNSELLTDGAISAYEVTFQRNANILSTGSSRCKIRVVPKGYLEFLEMDIGLKNPALAAAGN